jgi:uncharacterized protein YndB with AHSA1/START domain
VAEIRLDVDYPHPVDRVWRALTDPGILDQWFIPGTFGTTIGAHYQLRPREGDGLAGPIDVEVLEAVEPQRLVMQWTGEKLHTEMTWVLMTTVAGARLSVVQTGFIGTPQSVRRTELRQAYTLFFVQMLPTVLDQIASGEVEIGAGRTPPLTAVPRQPRTDRPATAPVGFLAQFARWPGRWRTIGTGAAVVALLALAVIVLVVGLSGDRSRQAQPLPQPLEGGAGATTPLPPDVTVSAATGSPGPARRSGPVPAAGGSAGSSLQAPNPGASVPTSEAPVGTTKTQLAAGYKTTKVNGNGAYFGQVTISASGPGTVSGWIVVVTLGGTSKIKEAIGAYFSQSGQTVTFTPSGNGTVSAGQPVSFTFHVNKKNDGTEQPLTCTVDGQPCTM